MSETIWWGEDPYWSEALDKVDVMRQAGSDVITIDLSKIDAIMFDSDGPAYRLLTAMKSVLEHESYDGYRGAPRLVYALLMRLQQVSDDEKRCDLNFVNNEDVNKS